jgi:hypothetical protein
MESSSNTLSLKPQAVQPQAPQPQTSTVEEKKLDLEINQENESIEEDLKEVYIYFNDTGNPLIKIYPIIHCINGHVFFPMYSRNMPRTASLSHPHVQFLPKSTSK